MKKILITGISGFVGWHINQLPKTTHEIVGTFQNNKVVYPNVRTIAMSLENQSSITSILDNEKPDALIHLAALSNPNYCETHKEESYKINVEATINLSDWCAQHQVSFLYASTDLVFDGKNPPYVEDDVCKPLMVYGMHKLMAEQYIIATNAKACIARRPLMYGLPSNNKGYLSSWIRKLEKGEKVAAFTDEFRTQVWAREALRGMLFLVEKELTGIYHLGSEERSSRYDFIVEIAEELGFETGLIKASQQADVNMPAKRPADVSLNSDKLKGEDFQVEGLQTFIAFLDESKRR